jgi:hypothetical protein
MWNLTDKQKEWLRLIGVGLVILGNLFLSVLGLNPKTDRELLSKECESWILNHDEYTAPPSECSAQVVYLRKRLDRESKEHGF